MKSIKSSAILALLIITCILIMPCCSTEQTPDCTDKKSQVVVNPDAISLSFAALVPEKIVFKGCGFNPGESILVEMLQVQKGGEKIDLAIANAQVKDDGTFEAEIGPVTKISEFMRAKIDAENNVVIVTGAPMHEGIYDVRVSSLMSDSAAGCTIMVNEPSIIDRVKDWIGKLLGKIVVKGKTD